MAEEPTGDARTRRRWSGPLAVVVGLAYIAWRSYDTLTGVAAWSAITVLAIEVAGLAGTTALLIALRRPRRVPRRRRAQPVAAAIPNDDQLGPVDVVVRFDGQSVGHLHATLAGARHMFDVRRVAVVTHRIDVATKAARGTAVEVIEADPKDQTRLRAAASFGDAPFVAVFDAGDVPQPGFTGVVRGEFVDRTIAVSQGCLVSDGIDSAEHDARGRHEMRFEREVLNPSLGARGGAVFMGSGAIVRRSLLQAVPVPRGARRSAELRWSIKVRAAGHALVAPGRPIVSAASINTERAVMAERRRSVRAALVTLMSRHDPLWTWRLRGSHRAGYLAWMVRPLSGLRRVAFVSALVACLVTNTSPVRPQSSVWVVAGLWAGWFVSQGWSIDRASDRRLRPGDRTRWSMRTMGASITALFGAGRWVSGDPIDAAGPGRWRGAGRNPFLAFALLIVASASVAVGVDRWRPFLAAVTSTGAEPWTRAALAAVAVWTVALMLDVMRCLVGGPQLRAAQRLRVRLDATVDDGAARITNLSPRGAGVLFEATPDLIMGDQVTMRFLVPTGSGTTAEVATIATVRSMRYDDARVGATLACGLEFGTMDRLSADALFAYCAVVHPGRFTTTDSGDDSGAEARELVAGSASQQRFLGVRLLGATALVGIGAAMMPPYGVTAAAQAEPSQTITVHLTDDVQGTGVEGARVVATCVAGRQVVDDREELLDIARTAIRGTRAQQRARIAAAARDAADRNLRRESVPSKQAAQEARWQQDLTAAVGVADEPSGAGDDPAAVGWHHLPSVQTIDSDSIVADDRGGGTYVVTDLPGWPCRVEAVDLPAGYASAPSSRRNGGLVQFAEGGDVLSMTALRADATAPIEIGNRVWLDADGDGVQDPSEPALAGVPVTLTLDGTEHRVVTGADGSYRFTSDPNAGNGAGVESGITGLRPGATVRVSVPVTLQRGSSAFHLTIADATHGVSPSIDSTVDPATGAVTFTVGQPSTASIDPSIDIGYSQVHALGDRVWLDDNNDGLRGPAEQGIDGVTVLLYTDDDGDGVPDGDPVDAQITSQGGLYAFGGLPAGRYVVDVHPPDGMVSSTGSIGRADGPYEPALTEGIDDDDDGSMLDTGVIRSGTVTLGDTLSPTGEVVVPDTVAGAALTGVPDGRGDATVDFGLFPARAIDDALWLDEDGDGQLSPDEPGLADVPLVLMRGEQVLAITTSDADGDFEFPNLTLGDFTVRVYAPAGLQPIGSLPPQTDDGELVAAPDATDATAVTPVTAVIDVTATTPTATDQTAAPETPETPETADTVATPETTAPAIPESAPAPAEDPQFEVIPVAIAPDWAGPDAGRALQRFGMWAPRSIGNMVWEDADDDGIVDHGEVGIPGVTVSLLDGDHVVARSVSAVDGTYRFVDLPDGTYRVAVDVPTTWRTSSVAWDDASTSGAGLDQSAQPRTTGRALSPPIHLGRVDVTTIGSFEHADLGLFQPRPTVTLAASGPDSPAVAAGSPITWNYLVTNTGNVPVSGLSVTDDSTASAGIDCNGAQLGDGQPLLLDVGRSVTCTNGGVAAAGPGRRTATVRASGESSPGSIKALDPVDGATTWFGSAPGLSLRTLVTVTSPGVDANSDGVLDSSVPPHLDALDDANRPGGADPTANHVVTDGARAWWVYEVQNTGTKQLTDVAVTDQQRGRVCGGLVLLPGERRFCVVADTLTRAGSQDGQARAVAMASGFDVTDPLARAVVGPVSDSAHAYVVQPGLTVTVSVDGSPAQSTPVTVVAGATAQVLYAVTNTGDVAFGSVALTGSIGDSIGGPINCPELSEGHDGLEPGETVTCRVEQRADVPAPTSGPQTAVPPATVPPAAVPTDVVAHVEAQPVAVEGGVLQPVVAEAAWSYVASTLAITDEAFVDADADTVHDAAEAPMPGVEVRLLDDHDQTLVTTTTDANGQWNVGALAPGVYSIQYVVPPGFLAAISTTTGALIVEPDAERTLVTDRALVDGSAEPPSWHLALVEAPPGQPGTAQPTTGRPDPGAIATTRIEDRVWNDVNGDGWLSTDERGFRNVVVTLVDASADVARPVAVTDTDRVGRFAFENVPAGKYVVAVGAVFDGTPLASLTPVPGPTPPRDAADLRSAVRAAGWAQPIVVDQRPLLQPELSLAVSPDTVGRLAPGRLLPEAPSILDVADLVPSSPAEMGRAMVFVACLVLFSLVIATARRRRLD